MSEARDDGITRARSPRGEVVLRLRPDGSQELRVNGVFVMDTTETSTERALATHALSLVARPARVLIGGLGLGFTAREVLADHRVERVTAVELEPALVAWMRDGTVPHGPALLADPRLEVVVAGVGTAVRTLAPASYDVVLLDVDNGPGHLVHDANGELYREPFLAACRAVLAPGGVLVVWSADPAPALEKSMGHAFGSATAVSFPVDLQGRAEHYWLLVGRAG